MQCDNEKLIWIQRKPDRLGLDPSSRKTFSSITLYRTTLSKMKIRLTSSVYRTDTAVIHVEIMYAASCIKSLEGARVDSIRYVQTPRPGWNEYKWVVVCWFKGPLLIPHGWCQSTFQSRRRAYVRSLSGKLHPLQPPACRPVTLESH